MHPKLASGPMRALPCEAHTRRVRIDSPLTAYQRLAGRFGAEDIFLLESAAGPAPDCRRSVLGVGRLLEVSVRGLTVSWRGAPAAVAELVRLLAAERRGVRQSAPGSASCALGRPSDGWDIVRQVLVLAGADEDGRAPLPCLAFFGYDAARRIERLPDVITGHEDVADIVLAVHHAQLVIPYGGGDSELTTWSSPSWPSLVDEEDPLDWLTWPEHDCLVPDAPDPHAVYDEMTPDRFAAAVSRCHEHIAAGDVYQVQIGHEISVTSPITPVEVFRRLRHRNPAPYMFLAQWQRRSVIGSSPELFVRDEGRAVLMRPIAGTARCTDDVAQRRRAVDLLRTDTKESAEHVMLVDLCRNDVARVAQPRSLTVDQRAKVEQFARVLHLVSTVRGTRDPSADEIDVVRALFPAGTMTGAPKIRAMEIIESLEASPRGLYAGAIGLITSSRLDLALCIRMLVHDGRTYHIRASAGIVADSIAEREWAETLTKMSAPFWAVTGKELV